MNLCRPLSAVCRSVIQLTSRKWYLFRTSVASRWRQVFNKPSAVRDTYVSKRCVLYRLDDSTWTNLGLGRIIINSPASSTLFVLQNERSAGSEAGLFPRTPEVYHLPTSRAVVTLGGAFVWTDSGPGEESTLAVKFRTIEGSESFRAQVETVGSPQVNTVIPYYMKDPLPRELNEPIPCDVKAPLRPVRIDATSYHRYVDDAYDELWNSSP